MNTILKKLADLKTQLNPHQQRVVNRIQASNQPGLVVAHGLGSGKTLTSIAAQEALGVPADIVVPASLRTNYRKEVSKHVAGKTPARDVLSLQKIVLEDDPPIKPLLIVDEAHRGKNLTEKYFKAIEDTARAQGAPSIHVYASNSGVGYWAQPRFGLKLDKASSEALHRTYEISRENNPKYQKVTKGDVHKYPRDFMEEVGFLLNMLKKPTYIHYYKKLDEPKKEGG
jgi:hypothetical protein